MIYAHHLSLFEISFYNSIQVLKLIVNYWLDSLIGFRTIYNHVYYLLFFRLFFAVWFIVVIKFNVNTILFMVL